MSNIHHATAKKAQQNGIILEEAGNLFRAFWPERNREAIADQAKDALADILALKMIVLEYPGLKAEVNENGDWDVTVLADEDEATFDEARLGDALGDALAYCEENALDPTEAPEGVEEEADEESKASGSVVPERYRQIYKEASQSGKNCGDWLASWLEDETTTADGFDFHEFRAILIANNVPMNTPWAQMFESGHRGWQGRFRMNGRQVLEKHVAVAGKAYKSNGAEVKVPSEALAILREKHAKFVAKAEAKASDDAKAAKDIASQG